MEWYERGSRISDGWMSGAWVLRTWLCSRLEMDSWTKMVWREDIVFSHEFGGMMLFRKGES